jgi:hypothetical protein
LCFLGIQKVNNREKRGDKNGRGTNRKGLTNQTQDGPSKQGFFNEGN